VNRTDRLLAMLLELQGREWTRGAQLAATFGISLRTVYRDVLALSESGVPVISLPGRGYQLMPGYFLPPLQFTLEEASLLSFGLDAARHLFDAEYARAADTAAQKVRAALPEGRRQDVDAVRERVRLVDASPPTSPALGTLRRAVLERRVVMFQYHKPHQAPALRRAEPQGLARVNGVWLLRAHDLERGEGRTFRVDRIEAAQLTAQHFERSARPLAPGPETEPPRQIFVLRFPALLSRALDERPSFFQIGRREAAEGIVVTLRARNTASVLPWVLSWGGAARVLEPPELREEVRTQARAMLAEP